MQTIIDTLLIVISNIPGIDETVYANIYDIEQTDKTVFVIVPGDISENITAYLVNGSIQLMSKVMLVLKSKYMETNIVITSKDNIKEFSLDNCSGVYNVIKYKRIYKRAYCGDSYEGMFVKSVNGLHGEVFLDIPQKISDLPNDSGYITEDELHDYTDKFNEIDSSIQDVSNRVNYIENDYVKHDELHDYTDKFNEIDSSIQDVSTRVHNIENDYVKHGDLPDYTDKFGEIDSSIQDVSSRVNDIENDYVKHNELPIIHDYTDKFNEIDSSISNVSTRVHNIENDYVKHNELPIIHDYTDKFNEIDSSISNVSTRVNYIENDYTTREYVDQKISEIVIESGVSSVNGLTGDVVIDIPSKVSDLQNDSNFISRQDAEDEFSKKADVYTKGQIDQKFVQTAQRIIDVSTNINNVSTNLNNEVSRLDQRIDNVSSNIPSLTDYAKIIYVDQKVQDVSTFVSDNFAKKSDIPTDYVNADTYNVKIAEIDSSISNASTRIKSIEDDYLKGLDKSYLEGLISGKQNTLVSGTNIKTINGNNILGSGNIEIQGGGGSYYTKEEIDKMFSDSSTYVSNYYVTQRHGIFTYLNDNALSLYSYYSGDNYRYDIKVGIYKTDYGTNHDPCAIVFNFNQFGENDNGIYMFTRGKIYAKMAGKFSSNIENDRLASMADLNEKLGDINTILESI